MASKHGCRKGERFSKSKQRKGASGCYVPTKRKKSSSGGARKGCSYGRRKGRCLSKKAASARRRAAARRLSKFKARKTSGGVAFLA